ncbi:MAG TPA: metalloregulator ArsR/SmtB family transcription factor [Candidatus Krumholzibacteria bacterium]|nr:metalloregulator ArsR/SmtB family transcription factor [Candidatus Krumholzibacteria bacterium]
MTYQPKLVALADPTRRAILERLRHGAMPVGKLAAGFDVTRPAVSQHLKILQDAGLVRSQRVGTSRFYSVDAAGLDELRRYLDHFWADVLAAFRNETERVTAPAKKPGRTIRQRKAKKHGKR